MNVSLPQDALQWLQENGFVDPFPLGWFKVTAAPQRRRGPALDRERLAESRDLATFVRAIKTLGAHSVSTADGRPGRVEVSRGADGDEILFRMRTTSPDVPPPRMEPRKLVLGKCASCGVAGDIERDTRLCVDCRCPK